MKETTPRNQRIYLRFEDAGMGMMRLAASITPPAYKEPVLVLLSRGVMPLGQPVSLLLVSDPTQNPALRGKDGDPGTPGKDGSPGASAYELARAQGYGGTLTQWQATLVGADGKSAYQSARSAGYGGTETQWVASLKGVDGAAATIKVGTVTTGAAGTPVTVTNRGTSAAAVFDFTIPAGPAGPAGVNAFGAPVSRTVAPGTAYQATDKTKPAMVTLNLTSSAALTLSGGQTHTADVLIGPTAASVAPTAGAPSGAAVAKYANSNTGLLSVGLALSTIATQSATIALPAGWFFAVRVTSGAVTVASAFDQPVG
jgi:hypothetical protein